MAGPLGEMFDHGSYGADPNARVHLTDARCYNLAGCDAMNTTLEVILCLRAMDLTRSWWTVASVAATAANFYLTTWEEFHTGTLFLGVFSGPVEGIIMIVVIYIVTGIYGIPTSFQVRCIPLTCSCGIFRDGRLVITAALAPWLINDHQYRAYCKDHPSLSALPPDQHRFHDLFCFWARGQHLRLVRSPQHALNITSFNI